MLDQLNYYTNTLDNYLRSINEKLSKSERLIYIKLLSGAQFQTFQQFANICGLSYKTTQTAFKRLSALCLVYYTKQGVKCLYAPILTIEQDSLFLCAHYFYRADQETGSNAPFFVQIEQDSEPLFFDKVGKNYRHLYNSIFSIYCKKEKYLSIFTYKQELKTIPETTETSEKKGLTGITVKENLDFVIFETSEKKDSNFAHFLAPNNSPEICALDLEQAKSVEKLLLLFKQIYTEYGYKLNHTQIKYLRYGLSALFIEVSLCEKYPTIENTELLITTFGRNLYQAVIYAGKYKLSLPQYFCDLNNQYNICFQFMLQIVKFYKTLPIETVRFYYKTYSPFLKLQFKRIYSDQKMMEKLDTFPENFSIKWTFS